ncbi:Copper radical oxidase [Glomus cerebriforme]|uniref:Copper radical oxidase n=1 Tax=Glomus cerebriforme TaxID=658196 RepID=A0A397TG71_9GLOM|nr:Copper radical oxidase [Glomus cerebriforme]
MIINMKNSFLLFLLVGGFLLTILSNNNVLALPAPMQKRQTQQVGDANGGTWEILATQTGVNAMHMFVTGPSKFVFVDKLEANALKQPNGQPAVSTEFDIDANTLRPLDVTSDTFCSAGSWLGNGTLVHTGGDNGNPPNFAPGQQTLRFYDPQVGDWVERIGLMLSKRWYPTMLPLVNGKVLILGGSIGGTGLNSAALNNPTYNIWPPSNNDTPDPDVQFPFLTDTLPYNLYVFVHIVPNSQNKNLLFVLANQQGILFDLDTATTVTNYPKIAVQRTYPQTGSSLMLPLWPNDNYKAEVMICGGQTAFEVTSTAEASCGRLDLTSATPAWEMDTFGGIPRVMPDSVILPSGQVVFLNGAQTGFAGFRKGTKLNPLWVNSNPAFNPVLYDPTSKVYAKMNPSTIARMYHSVATLTPDGYILVAGSNPQASVQTGILFSTEYRMEIFRPPYLLTNTQRPTILNINGTAINQYRIPVTYGDNLLLVVSMPTDETPSFTASIIHLGFVTHSQNMGQRFVGLVVNAVNYDVTTANRYIVSVTLPPNPTIIAPGPHFIYILNNNVPCVRAAEVLLN